MKLDKVVVTTLCRLGLIVALALIAFSVWEKSIYWLVSGVILLLAVYYFSQRKHRLQDVWLNDYLDTVVRNIERANNYAVNKLPVGIAVFDTEGKLQWSNELFEHYLDKELDEGEAFNDIIPAPNNHFETLSLKNADKPIKLDKMSFNMLIRRIETTESGEQSTGIVVYLLDITYREQLKQKFADESFCLGHVQFDNYNDIMKGLNESTRANLIVEVTKALADWVDNMEGVLQRYADDMYFVGISRKALEKNIDNKFEILDKIREINIGNKLPPTLSIGFAAEEKSLQMLTQRAQASLDLALGRGGDQVAVSLAGEMQFFGAKNSVQAKSTRVRARIVAQALRELMENADKIFVMGHVNEDYDSLGAALGIAKMALSMQKDTSLVVSEQGVSYPKLKEMLSAEEHSSYTNVIVTEEEALPKITDKSLLVLVDHHRSILSASRKVLDALPKRVIIDHHRQAEDIIQKPLLQYLEPSSSSTGELVTELLHYFDDRLTFDKLEASVLYAGILVDTKNFAVQAGERTFDAAALLRRNGADPQLVKQLFKDDVTTVVTRAQLIVGMTMPCPGLAVAVYRHAPQGQDTSVIVAQVADEMLNVEDVHVSVAIGEYEDGLGISARSDGTVNVQVMMEELGGGGHQTVAGVRIDGVSADSIVEKITQLAQEQLGATSAEATVVSSEQTKESE